MPTFLVLAAVIGAPAAFAQSAAEVQHMVIAEALNSRVPPALALAVAKVESNFNARAVSSAGARGVMQIMPKTARDVFGVGDGELWNARLNIQLGLDYLEQLHDQYGGRWDLALSHYNGGTLDGSGAFAVPHAFTVGYIAEVQRWQRIYSVQIFHQAPDRRGWGYEHGRPDFVPVISRTPEQIARDDRPWRNDEAVQSARIDRPWRNPSGIDPLEFNDWAEGENHRTMARRGLDDFGRPLGQ